MRLLQIGLVIFHPIDVALVCIRDSHKHARVPVFISDLLPFTTAELAKPAMDFGVTIEKGKTASTVVIRGGDVAPTIIASVPSQGRNVVPIINRIRVLIKQNYQV